MECRPPRPPSPSPLLEASHPPSTTTTPSTPILVTSEGHLVFPLPLLQGLDAPTPMITTPTPSTGDEDTPTPSPTPSPTPTPTPAPATAPPTSAFTPVTTMTPTTTPSPRPTTPRPTTPRRPTPRRPAPQPPTRPAPPTTPVPQLPPPTSTPTPQHSAARPASPASTRSASPGWQRSLSTTPVPELASPTPTPPGSSVGVGGLSLRLIDDETDTDDDTRCDSFEERLVFPQRPPHPPTAPTPALAPARLTLTRPPPLTPQHQPHASPRPAIQAAPHLPEPPRPPPPAEAQWWEGGRRAHRGLAHSSSDPGLRRPPVWSPAAPLQQVPEERAPPCLSRSDSVVTVPQDLLAPRPSLAGAAAAALVVAALMPGTAMLLHAAFRVVFGTLFPAYYSYKAVKTKNVKEYVKWMMYWIVFAFFTCLETLTDIFLSFWFPFYYELKILVVLWLLSPATRGSSFLYRKFVHPWLTQREEDIDNCIAQAKEQGYSAVLTLGSKGINYATSVIMQTAIKGGGGLMNQLKRSYSSGELITDGGDLNRNIKPMPLHLQDPSFDPHHQPPGPYDHEPRVRAESDAAYKSRGSSASRVVRSNKTRSADVTDYYQDGTDEGSIQRRRSPRNQDSARSQPTLHFQEPPPREPQRKRGKSENRPRPKSMINAAEVTRGAEWARAQRLGSTYSLNTDVELSESSSHSSLASAAGGHAVRPKARTSSTRRRQDSQGRRTSGSSSRAATRQPPAVAKQTSLEAASESE
ncbi:uncharacterized protein LOC123519545 isoform X2 [Portunus trituberculatus]|uniref:uncharacterized protein LOC123519545 isoform X2 n=1 Tax=Portunus trituberculatus TaxID=210409 RepID=UPI001E1D219C|nr:uncharacterized protein LOC123519545 isoform X2 [Portunus trituberculatus]